MDFLWFVLGFGGLLIAFALALLIIVYAVNLTFKE